MAAIRHQFDLGVDGVILHGAAPRDLHRPQVQARDDRDDPDVGRSREHVGAAGDAQRPGRGDRQAAHERIRLHSIEAARALKNGAERNDMLDRLSADPEFGVSVADLESVLDPARFVGRAPQQVEEFLDWVVGPLLAGHTVDATEEVRV